MQIDVRVKIRGHPGNSWSAAVLRCLGPESQWRVGAPRAAALRLGTARAVGDGRSRTGTGGIRICRDGDSGQKRRTQDRGFAKSEHMTPSSVSSALVEWTPHGALIISCASNRLFDVTQ
jgi:hypothetical protein